MASKLAIYNQALAHLGVRPVSSLTDYREDRRALDDSYADVVAECLEAGMWNFAMRDATLTSVGTPSFGFAYRYAKPADIVHIFALSGQSTFDRQLVTDAVDQGASIHSDSTPIYIRYTSNDVAFGGDLTKWPGLFTAYAAAALAARAAYRIRPDLAQACADKAMQALGRVLLIESVPDFPGMAAFNAQARAKISENDKDPPVEVNPFGAMFRAPPPAKKAP